MSSDDSNFTVSGTQVDPGMKDWAKVKVHVFDEAGVGKLVASVIATKVNGQGYGKLTEYWHGHKGAKAALRRAVRVQIDHQGSYSWNDFEAKWGTDPERRGASCTASVDACYVSATAGPADLFEGPHVNQEFSVRFSITFSDDDDIVEVFWAHNGKGSPYLVDPSTNTVLASISGPEWPQGWNSVTAK